MSRMMRETKMIMQFINEVGGITYEQAQSLLDDKADNLDYYIGCLNGYYIKETYRGSGIFVAINNKKPYSKKAEMCAWIMLDNEVNKEPEEKEYFKGEHPAQLFFLSKDTTYITMYADANSLNSIHLMEEVYASRGDDSGSKMIFVVDNDNAKQMILDANLLIPYCIAQVTKEEHKKPVIEYYMVEAGR